MAWTCETVNFHKLRPAASEQEYRLHIAALEWSLAEPIVIHGPEDIKSSGNWKGRFDPYHHQVQNLITFCRRLPCTLLADDVGLGKTISAGLILSELIARKRVSRTFVICPAILGKQWVEELVSKFNIPAVFAKGSELDGYLSHSNVPVVVTTFQTASARIEKLRADQFDMVILDEAHKMRNLHGTDKPPKMATNVRSALNRRLFKYVLMLTATPIQNRIWDLYSLLDLLTVAKGHQHPLGTPEQFRARYLLDGPGRRLNPITGEEFRSIVRQYVVRTRREDAKLEFPERDLRTRRVQGTAVEQEMMKIVAEEIADLNPLAQISIAQAMMSSPQALAQQLENMTGRGSVPESAAMAARRIADRNPITAKMQGLMTLAQELRRGNPKDWRMVVFTTRQATQEAIGKLLTAEGIAVGYIRGGQATSNQGSIERYRADPPTANVIVSTDAGAEGVNLQAGNVLVNYDLPWNPMVLEQRIGRVQRLKSKFKNVTIMNLVVADSIEERVVGRLMEKLQAIAHTIGDIEAILESTGQDDEDSFEEMIRKLVVKAMKGQDIERAVEKEKQSIEAARKKLEDEHENIEDVLGRPPTEDEQGPKPPKFTPATPSMPAEDFVLKALAAEGAKVFPKADDTFDVHRSGQPVERITFKPEVAEALSGGVFGGNQVHLYLPGRPRFEKLVQRWFDRSGHCVRDLSANVEALTLLAAKQWCESVPDAVFEGFTLGKCTPVVRGEMVCMAKAANGVDSIEKVISIEVARREVGEIDPAHVDGSPMVRSELSADLLFPNVQAFVNDTAGKDKNINAFCDFYERRRREEIAKAGADTRRQAKVEADHAPKVFADVHGIAGVQFDVAEARVAFVLDEHHRYEVDLKMIPATRQVLKEPERATCSVTDRVLPRPCIGTCEITGALCTLHLLKRSAASGKLALPDETVTCEVCGETLLGSEAWESALTGKLAAIRFFSKSPVSGRVGITTEDFEECEVTGTRVLRDELTASEVSGRMFRNDQEERSSVSGERGHVSEFVRCEETGEYVLPSEAGQSALTGKFYRGDLLIPSEKTPDRLGLKSEGVQCNVSGKWLLLDEVVRSEVSGKPMDRDLAAFSDLSKKPALPGELLSCDVTGQALLPAETGLSDVSGKRVRSDLLTRSAVSGRFGLSDEFESCQITGAKVLKDELLTSDESGCRFRQDEKVVSADSGKIAHKSETILCAGSGKPVLRSEAAQAAMSGKWFSKRLLQPSDKSPNRYGIDSDMEVCAKSKKRLLLDEMEMSAVSEQLYDRDLLRPSDRSGRLALQEELVTCAESGRRLLPSEADTCFVTGKKVDTALMRKSEVSGKLAIEREMTVCDVTGKQAAKIELRSCEVTGKQVIPSELETCVVTGKRAIRDLLTRSDVSGVYLLKAEAVKSGVSDRFCTPKEAVRCEWRGVAVLPDEVLTCRLTGLTVCRLDTNERGELAALRDLLDGRQQGGDAPGLLGWLTQSVNGQLPNLKAAKAVGSPDGSNLAVRAEMRAFLGLKVRVAGLVLRDRGERKVLGRICTGRVSSSGWVADG